MRSRTKSIVIRLTKLGAVSLDVSPTCHYSCLSITISDCLRTDCNVQELKNKINCVIVLYNTASDVKVNFIFNLNFPHCVTVKYRVIHKSRLDFRPLRYRSWVGHAEGEHVNRREKFQVSVLLYRCSICPPLVTRQMSIM
jgi:hypothetical protein